MKDLDRYYNKVDNLTAICRDNNTPFRGVYPELEIGKTYKVTYIGVLRSRSDLMLEGFGHKEYNCACFDLYENGFALGKWFVDDTRFLAPYLREMMDHRYVSVDIEEFAIPRYLQYIEKEYGVRILLAVLTGSRARGMASELSDWDVSFIYTSEKEVPDAIKRVYRGDVDLYGWDLKNAQPYLEAGNPAFLEWIHSPKVFYADDEFLNKVKSMEIQYFNKEKAIEYYFRSVSQFNERFLEQKENLKSVLLYIRGLLSCIWVEQNGSVPPMLFKELVEATVKDEGLRAEIGRMIESRKGGEKENGAMSSDLKAFLQNCAAHFESA